MYTYDIFLCDSLEKVFPAKRPRPMAENSRIPVFEGCIPAVQLVYNRFPGEKPAPFITPLAVTVKGAPVEAVLRSVELIPAEYRLMASQSFFQSLHILLLQTFNILPAVIYGLLKLLL